MEDTAPVAKQAYHDLKAAFFASVLVEEPDQPFAAPDWRRIYSDVFFSTGTADEFLDGFAERVASILAGSYLNRFFGTLVLMPVARKGFCNVCGRRLGAGVVLGERLAPSPRIGITKAVVASRYCKDCSLIMLLAYTQDKYHYRAGVGPRWSPGRSMVLARRLFKGDDPMSKLRMACADRLLPKTRP